MVPKLLRKKPKKQKSVLRSQRVGHAVSPKRKAWFARLAIFSLAALILGLLAIRVRDTAVDWHEQLVNQLVLTPRDWRLEVWDRDFQPLPEDIRREITNIATKHLKTGSALDLGRMHAALEASPNLDNVLVTRPTLATVIVQASVRRPVLLVAVGTRTRYVTSDGIVFGDTKIETTTDASRQPANVTITGLFDSHSGGFVDQNGKLVTSGEERSRLMAAIQLWRDLSEQKIEIKTINVQKFRGFSITASDETEIVLGLPPFDYKLKKLKSLVEGLRNKGVAASRIELDYDGKAFVKEKKL